MNDKLALFPGEQFLNLRTYRKSGETIPTPVWFVQEGETLYVRTGAHSGKVRRLTRSPRVDVAPCDYSGRLRADWIPASARLVDGEAARNVSRLFRRKYGLQKVMFELFRMSRKFEWATIAIQPE